MGTWFDETIILDLKHLQEFTGGDDAFRAEMLALFLERYPGYISELEAASLENWRACAHKLKGAARSIGAWQLASYMERLEKMASPPPLGSARVPFLEGIKSRLARLKAHIVDQKIDVRNY